MSIVNQSTVSSAYTHSSEMGMDVYCLIGEGPTVCIFHTARFLKTLSWIEYDINSSRLDFVMEDGDIKNFGIAIDRKFAAYIKNTYIIPVVLRENGEAIEGFEYPLIQHAA